MPVAAAFALDAVLVIVFAAIGRSSHNEGLSVGGIADTAWPFLVGLVLGWFIATVIARTVPLTLRTGWPVWVLTVAIGMLLRLMTGDGTAIAFVIVATLTLGVLLLGWRAIAELVQRRITRTPEKRRHTADAS